MKKISLISTAFNEEKNLPELYAELVPVLENLEMDWEWIIIDDHSTDSTPEVIKRLSQSDSRIKGLRMAKNKGSHALCLFGFQKASGDYAVLLPADGQDPPAYITRLVEELQKGAHKVVWLTRENRRGDPFFKRLMARLYYFVLRNLMGLSSIPPNGGDMVLVDAVVLEELRKIREKNFNILVTIAELGFSQAYIPGKRRPRVHGKSNFTFVKNFNLLFDTLTAHSVVPLRIITCLGFFTAFLGFLYGIVAFIAKLKGLPIEGWTSLILTILVIGGVQMVMLGVIGEYLWRTLENTRQSSGLIVESEIGEWKN